MVIRERKKKQQQWRIKLTHKGKNITILNPPISCSTFGKDHECEVGLAQLLGSLNSCPYHVSCALLWQKEASDKSPKSGVLMFLEWTYHVLLPVQVLSRNTHPAERYLSQDIMILHWCQCTWQTHFAHLREISFSRVASFCQSGAVVALGSLFDVGERS